MNFYKYQFPGHILNLATSQIHGESATIKENSRRAYRALRIWIKFGVPISSIKLSYKLRCSETLIFRHLENQEKFDPIPSKKIRMRKMDIKPLEFNDDIPY
jgi:hypothetical protein